MVVGETRGAGFYPLLIAAASVADSENLERLRAGFPDVIAELEARRAAPGGELDEATEARIEAMPRPDAAELGQDEAAAR
jgi:hypothetical protein